MAVFKGYSSHYGAGLGNVLSGLLRSAVPLVAPALRNVGKSLISAGASRLQNLIDDSLGASSRPMPPPAAPPPRPPPPRRRRLPVKRPVTSRRRSVKKSRRSKADIFGTK